MIKLHIDPMCCISCGATASFAPELLLAENDRPNHVIDDMATPTMGLARMLSALCPVGAIRVAEGPPMEGTGVIERSSAKSAEGWPARSGPAFDALFEVAEAVRWPMRTVPFQHIDRAEITEEILSYVSLAVRGEFRTYGATRAFMDLFADDDDFSNWLSIWLYEETKHSHALRLWLQHAAGAFDVGNIHDAHRSTPFSMSRCGTLANNVIAEMVAAESYLSLARLSAEPVLARVATYIAADEARHASHFLCYLLREFERCTSAEDLLRGKCEALTVLQLWLRSDDRLTHPSKTTLDEGRGRVSDAPSGVASIGSSELRSRISAVLGLATCGKVLNGLVEIAAARRLLRQRFESSNNR